MRTVLITGAAGFIGFHLAQLLLEDGYRVIGYDAITDYYDPQLKRDRLHLLERSHNFLFRQGALEDMALLSSFAKAERPDVIVHLAAQAGVRYSLENPRAYIESNVVGTFNVMECARELGVDHLLMASTSSVYGANTQMPYAEAHKADLPMTIYAATKKANEAMGHSYAHLYDLPTTMFRFFTVYGPWGRPDMAYYKFTDAILRGRPIDIYNHGEMFRDFTYVGDLVRGIRLLIDVPPVRPVDGHRQEGDSLSPVAPHRIVNIGNNDKVRLMDMVEALELALGRKATCNFMEIQPGDVPATWADCNLLQSLTGYKPRTSVQDGLAAFVEWYRFYYTRRGVN